MRVALHAAFAVAVMAATHLNDEALPDEALLARQKLGAVPPKKGMAELDDVGSLEALWEREAELAQLETARFLKRAVMSIEPTTPPGTPTGTPMDPPTDMPTVSPVDPQTDMPTPTPPTSTPPPVEPTTPVTPIPETQSPSAAPSPLDQTPVPTPVGQTAPPTQTPTESPIGGDTASPSAMPSPGRPTTPAPTGSDFCLEGQPLADYLIERLSPITDPELLADPATAQGMALQFMANDPLVQSDVCRYPTLEQRYGLATFYYSTLGDDWTTRTAWLTDVNECQWFGVICSDDVRATNLTLSKCHESGMNSTWTCRSKLTTLVRFHLIRCKQLGRADPR